MKHLTINDVQPEDYKYIVEKPDKDFSPERNYAVIADVIRKNEKMHAQLGRIMNKDAQDRIDVLSSYARYRFNVGTKAFDKYVGKDWMRKITGEKILEKVRIMDSIVRMNRENGNT